MPIPSRYHVPSLKDTCKNVTYVSYSQNNAETCGI